MKHRLYSVLLGLLLAHGAQAADEVLHVRAQPSVAVFSAPAADATIVQRLTPGDSVTVRGRDAGYVHVELAAGNTGWMQESDLTAVTPPALRASELEAQIDELRLQLANTQNVLRTSQANLQQARQAANNAQDSGADVQARLAGERDRLAQALEAREAELIPLRARIAELEMAREAATLLAERQPIVTEHSLGRFSITEYAVAGALALLLALSGMWLGTLKARRRLRQRYHGLEL